MAIKTEHVLGFVAGMGASALGFYLYKQNQHEGGISSPMMRASVSTSTDEKGSSSTNTPGFAANARASAIRAAREALGQHQLVDLAVGGYQQRRAMAGVDVGQSAGVGVDGGNEEGDETPRLRRGAYQPVVSCSDYDRVVSIQAIAPNCVSRSAATLVAACRRGFRAYTLTEAVG